MRNRLLDLVFLFAPLVGFLVFWELASRWVERGVYFYGSPLSVGRHLVRKTLDGSLPIDMGVTALESIIGFITGTLAGTALGVALGYWPAGARVAKPYVLALGVIPIFTVAPILIIWFGIGLVSKVVMSLLSTVFVATFQAYEGVRGVDADYVFLLDTLGASRLQMFRQVVLPSALTWVVAGMRLNIGFAILGAFIGEYIASDVGLGHLIVNAAGLFNVPLALAGVLAICVLAMTLVGLVGLLERVLMPWRLTAPPGAAN